MINSSPTPEVVVVVVGGVGEEEEEQDEEAGGVLCLGGHTRRLFLINSDVRKNKQSADPTNYALFYLILRRGVGGNGV